MRSITTSCMKRLKSANSEIKNSVGCDAENVSLHFPKKTSFKNRKLWTTPKFGNNKNSATFDEALPIKIISYANEQLEDKENTLIGPGTRTKFHYFHQSTRLVSRGAPNNTCPLDSLFEEGSIFSFEMFNETDCDMYNTISSAPQELGRQSVLNIPHESDHNMEIKTESFSNTAIPVWLVGDSANEPEAVAKSPNVPEVEEDSANVREAGENFANGTEANEDSAKITQPNTSDPGNEPNSNRNVVKPQKTSVQALVRRSSRIRIPRLHRLSDQQFSFENGVTKTAHSTPSPTGKYRSRRSLSSSQASPSPSIKNNKSNEMPPRKKFKELPEKDQGPVQGENNSRPIRNVVKSQNYKPKKDSDSEDVDIDININKMQSIKRLDELIRNLEHKVFLAKQRRVLLRAKTGKRGTKRKLYKPDLP